MTPEAVYLNGVYDAVLRDICAVQRLLPDHIMFLQPYKAQAIALLRDSPPSVEYPRLLLASTTEDLGNVTYVGEIVGWEDKTTIGAEKRALITRLLKLLQKTEDGVYDASAVPGKQSVNLLYVRRLRPIHPLPVTSLLNVKDGQPLAKRTTAGGWVYVAPGPHAHLLA